MPNVRLVVEYCGEGFSGWQVQPDQRTVQGELHRALEMVTGEALALPVSAGRTDAGVSAKRQVVCCTLPRQDEALLRKIMVGVSSILKNEVSILRAEVVPEDFHPRYDALRKQYTYTIWNHPSPPALLYGRCKHVSAPLHVQAMQIQGESLLGEHDFTSFRGSRCGAKSPVRKLESFTVHHRGDEISLEFRGPGFLKQMVRNIVGTLLLYGADPKRTPSVKAILEARDRKMAGPTAEPWGLTLDWIEYKEGRL
ncbi:tRNA pseudouridine(38-40) synthase TruA [bacterium]|nr:tRNA pseudouridine(38-40) synthase TruA [bacterium]